MLQLNKMQILKHEMDKVGVDVCGLTEVRWKGQGHFHTSGSHTVIDSGNEKQKLHGIATWVDKKIAEAITNYESINEGMMMVQLNTRPKNITLLQVYASTAMVKEEDVGIFYEELEPVTKNISKGDITMMMGYFNAKVEKRNIIRPVVGP